MINLLALEMATNPTIRKMLRITYREEAVINTKPTAKGSQELDPSSPYARTKFIKDMPISELLDPNAEIDCDLFLYILHAYNAGYITYTIAPRKRDDDKTNAFGSADAMELRLNDMKALYCNSELYDATYWNDIRKKAVDLMYSKHLMQKYNSEIIAEITHASMKAAIRSCVRLMQKSVMRAPFSTADVADVIGKHPAKFPSRWRIMALLPGETSEHAVCVAVLDGLGTVLELNRIDNLLTWSNVQELRENASGIELARQQAAVSKSQRAKDAKLVLEKLIDKYRPQVMVLGTRALSVCQDLSSAVDHMVLSMNAEHKDIQLHKTYCDVSVSQRVALLKTTEKLLPDMSEDLRATVCMGRMFLDPAVEYARLMERSRSIADLNFHPLMSELDQEKLMTAYEHLFVGIVSERGVDLDRCRSHPHTASLLQFVPGLGPRKAAHLLSKLQNSQVIVF